MQTHHAWLWLQQADAFNYSHWGNTAGAGATAEAKPHPWASQLWLAHCPQPPHQLSLALASLHTHIAALWGAGFDEGKASKHVPPAGIMWQERQLELQSKEGWGRERLIQTTGSKWNKKWVECAGWRSKASVFVRNPASCMLTRAGRVTRWTPYKCPASQGLLATASPLCSPHLRGQETLKHMPAHIFNQRRSWRQKSCPAGSLHQVSAFTVKGEEKHLCGSRIRIISFPSNGFRKKVKCFLL